MAYTMHAEARVAAGSVTGTGAAINVSCGFIPKYVKVFNIAAGGLVSIEWTEGMTSAYGFKTAANGATSYITSLGITPSTANGTFAGFTIGADTDLNVNSEGMTFIAIG